MSDHLSKEQIIRYRERQIPANELVKVDSHLSDCRNCREEIARSYDFDAALAPRISTRPIDADSHVSYEQLEAYTDRRMPMAESISLRNHIHSCPACAADLRDLESLRDELERSLKESEPFWRETEKHQGWKVMFTARSARLKTAAALAAMMVLGALIWQHNRYSGQSESTATNRPVPQETSKPSNASLLSAQIAALEPAEQQKVREAIENRKLIFPSTVANLTGSGGILMGASSGELRFAVTSPAGEFVPDLHPLFRWRALPGARSYSVTIFDANLNSVVSSPALHDTQWKSNRALSYGRVYLWQVTATLGDGTTVNSPQPPSPEAKFQILDQSKADKLEQFRQSHSDAHLVLGILYAEAGALDAAEQELKQLSSADPDYQPAQDFLANIRQLRRTPQSI